MARPDAVCPTTESSHSKKLVQDAKRETLRMNKGVEATQRPSADARWWKTGPSLAEIAEQLERALVDKQALEGRLADVFEENRRLCENYDQSISEFAQEQERLKFEIEDLRWQVAESRKQLQEKPGAGRQVAELAARERLLKDEYERKVQALQLELNKERHQFTKERTVYTQRIEKMQLDRAACICRGVQIEHVERDKALASSVLPEGWKIRNSK
jgi:DNA repair exonuclease SbcCD ATPase subunit